MYVMVNEAGKFRITKIINVSGSTLTSDKGDKYNIEKVKYIWKNGAPIYNKQYVGNHLLKDKFDTEE